MKTIILTILLIVLVIMVGTWPLSVLSIIFEYIGIALKWLAGALNFFGWNGLI